MTREDFLLTLLRFAAEDEEFDPDSCGFAVAVGLIGNRDSWWPFKPGEIVVLQGDAYGREPFGEGRKPAKWDVDFEWFGHDIERARARSAEVRAPAV